MAPPAKRRSRRRGTDARPRPPRRSASAWSATRSWAPPTPRGGAPRAASSTCRCGPVLAAICGRDADAVRAAADRHGWAAAETDWRALIARDDVQLVDICTPGDSHAEIAIAALEAGKHVLCEKPLANSVAEAEAMADGGRSGPRRAVSWRWSASTTAGCPPSRYARRMVAEGRLGALRHVRVTYLQDWLVDPEFPLTWRLRREHGGLRRARRPRARTSSTSRSTWRGSRWSGVSALTETFVRERPAASPGRRPASSGAGGGGRARPGHRRRRGPVHRPARLRRAGLLRGDPVRRRAARTPCASSSTASCGSLAFDLERLNELSFHDHTEPAATSGFRRILVTEPEHPYLEAWWPPGHALGYEHTFVHQARDLVHAIAAGTDARAVLRRRAPGAAGARRGRGERREELRLHPRRPSCR